MRSHTHGVMSEINVTPLVDVMLVLLVIFMVTAPLLREERVFDVRLPSAATGQPVGGAELSITLTKDHLMYVGGQLVTLKELRRRLERAGAATPVSIQADRRAYVEKLIELWDVCRQAGLHEVHIATIPPQ